MAKYADVTAGQTEACINRMGGWDNFLRFIGGSGKLVFDSILELITSEIKVSAREKFVVADHFKKGNAGIYFLSDNFKARFGGLVENASATILSSRKLTQSSVDEPIRAELGKNHETFLSWLFEKLEQQADGREGDLLVNGYANIWYVLDASGVVRAVLAYWSAGRGWDVDANGVSNPRAWGDGDRVFSRNSVLESSDTAPATTA